MTEEQKAQGTKPIHLRIVSHDVTLAPEFREMVLKKLQGLNRIFHGPIDGELEVRKERGRYVVEISLKVSRYLVRSQERGKTIREALDRAVDKVDRQIRRHKERLLDRHRVRPDRVAAEEAPPITDQSLTIGRVKQYGVKPMTVEEAAITMDLLGHDFFVFVNAETNRVNVLYRRAAGDLGLLEPGEEEE
ncbi:MAG: ribosome-associated translation inhibitor RaiA [Armatimonadetes bacterium]|nr:ribosome-associated translation inhibitor RaiA [Armatimonadota bacterium]MDW8121654.1 ribosome-associated translation inhibitor RaiA [Armatimonadota bacterium]